MSADETPLGPSPVAGVDEAGRGPLAGPVVAAAVVLPEGKMPPWPLADSKSISHARRVELFGWLHECGADIGVGSASHEEIDALNILRASLLAMKRAVQGLRSSPGILLIDGIYTLDLPLPQEAIVRGDATVPAISAASIIAKVTRDRIMDEYHLQFPCYGFDLHKGYPTKSHKEAIVRHGPSSIHRRSFRGVKGIGPLPKG